MADRTEHAIEEEATPLREYIAVLRLRKWSVLGITFLVLASTLFFSFQQTPIYESEAKVLVKPVTTASVPGAVPQPPNLETERELVASSAVAEIVGERLDVAEDPEALLDDLEVEVATSTEILLIRYGHPDPLEAQRRTQAFADSYLEFRRTEALEDLLAASDAVQKQISSVNRELVDVLEEISATNVPSERAQLEARQATLTSRIAVLEQKLTELTPAESLRVGQVVQVAELPSSPASPNYLLNAALALFVGLALGVGLAFLRERLDDRLRGRDDLEARSGAPVFAVVPRVGGWKKRSESRLVTLTEPRSAPTEAYRTLRTGLLFAASQRDMRTVLITSPQVDEGKSTTAANLSVVLAQAGKRVILIDADLRKPRLHRFFQAPNEVGLTSVLSGQVQPHDGLAQPQVPNLRVLTSGPVPGNPAELLSSDQMGSLVKTLREAADLVIMDSPPVLVAADATILASFADGLVLVADADNTTRGTVAHARQQLDQVNARVVASVLNNFDPSKALKYPYYYQYYYTSHYGEGGDGSPRAQRAEGSMWSR